MMSLSGNELCAARQCLAEGEARALAKIKSIRKSWLFVLACTMQYQALRILLIFTSIIPVLSFPSLRYGAVNLGGFFLKVTHRAPARYRYLACATFWFPLLVHMIGCYFHGESGEKRKCGSEKKREEGAESCGIALVPAGQR